ncbi:hypothetical protein H1R20_g11534, partial [Candolleomyces eurysporus]
MLRDLQYRTPSSPSPYAPLGEGFIGFPPTKNPDIEHRSRSFFEGAQHFRMGNFQYFEANHVTVNPLPHVEVVDGWKLLVENMAPNALHDSGARYDAPMCDEDTRVEVTSEIMDWIKDRNAPQRLLCMTGAAGAGKSALQQTITERCEELGILASAFFFSNSDFTRNTISTVVPTIAFQVGSCNPDLRHYIGAAVANDPVIFKKSLRTQLNTLIVRPLQQLRKRAGLDLATLPYAILIDGLDECTGEDHQAELLTAVRRCLLADDLPFRIFVASRPEWAIRTALEPGGHLNQTAYHIQLSDKYDADEDIRRYLRRRFEEIGLRIGDSKWFSDSDIEALVEAASGQFVYVAVVCKYISQRRASPSERLKVVRTWTPHMGQMARPFEALDRLYTNILLAAKNAYEAVDTHHGRDFLILFRAHHINAAGFQLMATIWGAWCFPADTLSALLGLETGSEEYLFSDLRSLVTLKKSNDVGKFRLHLYHKSFSDFLREKSRAKDLFVPDSRVHTHLARCFNQQIIECPLDFDSLPDEWEELPLSEPHKHSLKQAIHALPFFLGNTTDSDKEVSDFTAKGGWHRIDKLLPLWSRRKTWIVYLFHDWIESLRRFIEDLTARNPDIAAVINAFVKKWVNEFKEQWAHEMKQEIYSKLNSTGTD